MANRVDVTFYDTNAFNGQPPFFEITNDYYRSEFAILHPITQEPFINPRIYQVKMTYSTCVKIGASFKFETSDVELEPCNVNKFGKRYRDLFRKKKLEGLHCAKSGSNIIRGHRSYDVYSFWTVSFYPCVNTTRIIICVLQKRLSLLY